jgi:hypothetical protein
MMSPRFRPSFADPRPTEPQAPPMPETPAPSIDPAKLSKAIIDAGKRRRGELPPEFPPEGTLARQIVDAGRRRRAEIP